MTSLQAGLYYTNQLIQILHSYFLYQILTHEENMSPALNYPKAKYQTTRDHPYSL